MPFGCEPSPAVPPRARLNPKGDPDYEWETRRYAWRGVRPARSIATAGMQKPLYQHLLYRERQKADPELLALFSEPIGDGFVTLLNNLGIAAVWLDKGAWRGSGAPADLTE